MKRKIILCTLALTALLLSGCSQGSNQGTEISTDAAKQIALDKVPGATTQDIREFESNYDNGRLEYQGEIHYERQEYEFEIDGYNGTILEWNVESTPLSTR